MAFGGVLGTPQPQPGGLMGLLGSQPQGQGILGSLPPPGMFESGLPGDDVWRLQKYRQALINQALGETMPARLVKGAISGLMLPGDVYAGKVDPLSNEGIDRAAELAGLVTLGSAAMPAASLADDELRAGIKVYHGSPHDFDKFELSDKTIGTGEGAQAYGHGLYMAENRDVAEGYKYATSAKNRSVEFDGEPLKTSKDWWGVQDKLESEDWRLRKAFDTIQSNMSQGYNTDEAIKMTKDWYRNQPDLVDAADVIARRMSVKIPPGRVYEVSLNAHPDDFLDWDKPLSEQSAKVRAAVDNIQEIKDAVLENELMSGLSGMGAIKATPEELAALQNAVKANTEKLRTAGIKGIRYKDAGSRATEGGTSNYVVFDDSIIDIIKKYGIAGLIAAGVGTSALTAQPGTAEAKE